VLGLGFRDLGFRDLGLGCRDLGFRLCANDIEKLLSELH
jgi:hypothetical protein